MLAHRIISALSERTYLIMNAESIYGMYICMWRRLAEGNRTYDSFHCMWI